MYSNNYRKKFGYSSLVVLAFLLALAASGFGGASAKAGDRNTNESFEFLTNNPALYFQQAIGRSVDSSKKFTEISGDSQKFDSITDGEEQIFSDFDGWLKSFAGNDFRADDGQIAEGERLAISRRNLIKQLIENNPKAALARALSAEQIAQLPDSINQYVEKRVGATGDFLVYVVEGAHQSVGKRGAAGRIGGDSYTARTVEINGNRYKAFVYGRREQMTTKLAIPLAGIVLDGEMAVAESAARIVNEGAGEAEIGGERMKFESAAAMTDFINAQIEWESQIGPVRPKTDFSSKNSAQAVSSPWTTGTKTILVIRADFSDYPGEPLDYGNRQPLTFDRAKTLYSDVNQFFAANSYGKTSVQATVVPAVVRLPQTLDYYKNRFLQEGNFQAMTDDARTAARNQNSSYDFNNYDFDVVAFTYIRLPGDQVGFSNVGFRGTMLSGAFFLPDAAHELGHNYGLLHANLFQTTDGTPDGNGTDLDYGDCFDMMAAACSPALGANNHFNVRYKNLLNWLPAANVTPVTQNGSYPIYAQDTAGLDEKPRAISIPRTDGKNYWIEYRQLLTNNPNTANGAIIRWDFDNQGTKQTQLLDMNPSTATTFDAPLVAGQTFTDKQGLKITVLEGNTSPKSLVVQVQVTDCTYSTSPTSGSAVAYGGNLSVNVIASKAGCAPWTAVSNVSWITVTSGASGTGNGTVSLSVAPNSVGERDGTVTIAEKTYTVTQAAGNCGYTVTPQSFSVSANGGNLSYTQNYSAGCSPLTVASTDSSWISISGGTITIEPNTGAARNGTVLLTGEDVNGTTVNITLNVHQSAPGGDCSYPLNSGNQIFSAAGGTGSFTIKSSTSGCSSTYSASSNVSWITISNPTGQTGDLINYSVAPNVGLLRSGTITVTNPVTGSQTFTVSQTTGCAFTINPSSQNIPANGGAGSFSLTASDAGCSFSASTSVSWITLTGNTSGTGSATINFTVSANTDQARSGTIIVGGQTFTINQAASCAYSLSSINISIGNSGGNGSVNVTSGAGCQWTAVSNVSWITITAGAGGSGSGTVNFSVTANSGTARTGTITIAGQTFTVNQADGCTFSLASTNTSFGSAGGSSVVNITTSAGCTWTATGNVTWITFTSAASGSGTGTVNFAVAANSGAARTGTISIGGQTLTISQSAFNPSISINNVSLNEGNSGTTAFNFTVSLLGASSQTVTVNYATANGTAIAPGDFQAVSGSLSFAPGDTTKTITVLINGNTVFELNKTFTVNLSGAVNATIANAQGVGTILNDDSDTIPCPYSVSPPNINVNAEGGSGNTFSVSTQGSSSCYSITATTTSSFIIINSVTGNAGSNGVVSFSVTANTGAARTDTISVNGLATVTVNQAAVVNLPSKKAAFDFDGDGKADISVFRPNNGVWYFLNSTAGFSAAQFGISTDKIVPADFDGDGKTDLAVFRDGNWYLLMSRDGFASVPFGSAGDIPVPADFDGDGRSEVAVFRPSNGVWYSFNLATNAVNSVQFGIAEDKPVVGDYDGDGKVDQAVYRPSNGTWYMLRSRDGFAAAQFGISTDKPVTGDYDGDGKADQAVYRAESGTWYILGSQQGFASTQFGISTDLPVSADYDGDGKTDIAVFRPDSGNWYQMKTTQGFGSVQFGAAGDKPTPNASVR